MTPITFCIATAGDERDYLALAIDSLRENTDIDTHEILVFIDKDTQGTYEYLRELQKEIPQLRIYKNEKPFPIGLQRNLSIMIHAAKNDVVCYLQSDMVAGKDLDAHIEKNLTDKDTILSLTRVEPPLHPPAKDKITKDFGLTPDNFKKKEFDSLVETIQSEGRDLIEAHFAPFAIHKSTWAELGGFDASFVCSREDSDFLVRAKLHGKRLVQTWDAIVYHFTCVSSRGSDWYTDSKEAQYKNHVQQLADQQEFLRFIRKWGKFDHDITHRYDVGIEIEIDRMVDFNVLLSIEPYFDNVVLSDRYVAEQLHRIVEFNAYYFARLRRGITDEMWQNYRGGLFGYAGDRGSGISHNTNAHNDVVVKVKYSDYVENNDPTVIQNIQDIVHQNEVGEYEVGPFTINIHSKTNIIDSVAKNLKSNGVYYDEIVNFSNYVFD